MVFGGSLDLARFGAHYWASDELQVSLGYGHVGGPRYADVGGLTGWDQDRPLRAGFTREEFVETAKEDAAARAVSAGALARRLGPDGVRGCRPHQARRFVADS